MELSLFIISAIAAIATISIAATRPHIGTRAIIFLFIGSPLYPMKGFEFPFYALAASCLISLFIWWLYFMYRRPPFNHVSRFEPVSIIIGLWLVLCAISLP